MTESQKRLKWLSNDKTFKAFFLSSYQYCLKAKPYKPSKRMVSLAIINSSLVGTMAILEVE